MEAEPLTSDGRIVAWGILAITAALVLASMLGVKLGLSTFIAGAATAVVALIGKRELPWVTLKECLGAFRRLVPGYSFWSKPSNRQGRLKESEWPNLTYD